MLYESLSFIGAVRYAFVFSVWAVTSKTQEGIEALADEWGGHFDEHPQRREMVVLHIVDSENEICTTAEINRFEDKPPTLSEWKRGSGEAYGRFPSLREVLRKET